MAVSLLLAGALLLSACASAPATFTAPRAIVDLSPSVGEDFAVGYLGRKMVELFELRERTTFEHVVFVGFPLKLERATGGLMRAAALLY